ncbi:MAG TPA: YCF48-related protein [Ignavibacteria bacterium]|nr:YCF48-related protein [Ignavibacteria bacterium]HMR39990.1 YCF48-related protein [Ignavibacteria bacterium]
MKTIMSAFLILYMISADLKSQTGWISQNSNFNKHLNDVFFINSGTGWTVSDSSKVLKTTDSGNSWNVQTLPYYSQLYTIFFIDENTGWTGGSYWYIFHGGSIFKTTNGGNDWFSLITTIDARSIYFINSVTGFAAINNSQDFSSGGSIIKTTNGGSNWTIIPSNHEFCSIAFKDEVTGYILGHYWDDTGNDTNFVYRTTDTGENWDIVYAERNEQFYYGHFRDISVQGSNVWVSGSDSSILRSSDNGENWSKQFYINPRIMNSIWFIDNNTGWAVGYRYPDSSNIIKTTNGGMNWFNLRNNAGNGLNSVMFLNEYTGWAAGDNGIILKTTTGGLTFVNNNVNVMPAFYSLGQNYPNPFNPVTSIEFALPLQGMVTMKIFDVLGNEKETIINEDKPAGNYKITFSGEQLSSGIYYYSLFIDKIPVKTRKMVLIK